MKSKKLSVDENQINSMIESGKINPIQIPRFKTSADIFKYELCSEIIKYKKNALLLQSDIALALDVNKSEVSKIFSYQLAEFSIERLLGMIENLIKSGADIRLENIFEQVKKKVSNLDKKISSRK